MGRQEEVQNAINVSIVGATGYSGGELLRLLSRHPKVTVGGLFAGASAGTSVASHYPWLQIDGSVCFESYDPARVEQSDLVFLALPSGEAMKIVPELIGQNKKVIDLGGDFRMKNPAAYNAYYPTTHTAESHLAHSVYGLSEWSREEITASSLIANPGCYATSILLPLLPLLKEGGIERSGIIINSMSGTSGAGRKGLVDLSFSEVNETVRAYRVGTHQHIPEVEQALGALAGAEATISFTPHLVPITRGIHTTINARPAAGITEADLIAIYDRAYAGEPFIRYGAGLIPGLRNVERTNRIEIGLHLDERTGGVVILSAIDNLMKGAAGQAVHNMNLMFGFEETEGLL